MSELSYIIGRISKYIGDKQARKVFGFGQVRPFAGGRHISNYYFCYKILTILHQNSDNIFK